MNLTDAQVRLYGVKNRFLSAEYPIYTFYIDDFNDAKNRIINKIDLIEKRTNLNDYPNSQDGDTGVKGATLAHSMFNIFADEELSDLYGLISRACADYARQVFEYDEGLFAKAWGNKLGQYQYMNRHFHKSDHDESDFVNFSLHLTVSSGIENYTVYTAASNSMDNSLSIPNIEGQINIFPCTLAHHTTPNAYSSPRYSLAMDVADYTMEGQPQWMPLD